MRQFIKRIIITLFAGTCLLSVANAQNKATNLEDCIAYALVHNTDMGRANKGIESSKANLEQSKAAILPNLSLSANQNNAYNNTYLVTETGGDTWNRDFNSSANLSINSSVSLYNGAKLKNSISQNEFNLAAAEADLKAREEVIALNVLTAYVNVLLAKEQVSNSESQVESTLQQLEFSRARLDAGLITKSEYLNIKSQWASDQSELVSAQSYHSFQLVKLMQIMNMPIDYQFDIQKLDLNSLLNKGQEVDPTEIYQEAIGMRSDIKSAQLEWESAKLGIDIAKANGKPKLSLNGSLGTDYNSFSALNFSEQFSNQITPSIGLSLSIPIYQGKQIKNQISQASIQADLFQLNLIDMQNNLRKAIEQAWLDSRSAHMVYEASQLQYQAETEAFRLAEEMLGQGLLNSVDFIISKSKFVTAENKLTQAKYQMILQNELIEYYQGANISFN